MMNRQHVAELTKSWEHQREVGTGYFDEVAQVIADGTSSATALTGSTEVEQFLSMD